MQSYDDILKTCCRAVSQVAAAGYDLNRCVWEFSPETIRTIEDYAASVSSWTSHYSQPWLSDHANSWMGIPFREVEACADGGHMTLILVNPTPHQ